jgi:PE-PPE domain
MRKASLSIAFVALTLGAVLLLAFTPLTSVVVALTATALFMGGTGHPLSIPQDTTEYITQYVDSADARFVVPSGLCVGGTDPAACDQVAVYTPQEFKFDTGLWDMPFDESVAIGLDNLDACVRGTACTVTKPPFMSTGSASLADHSYVVFGYSQSATIAAFEKYDLIAHPPAGTTVSFVVMSNPNRPNGGILERFVGAYIPILGVTFSGAMTTNSPDVDGYRLTTVDVAHQYDPVSDFPTNPLNLLADLNVLLGFLYFHPETAYFAADSFALQGQYQDTTYYLAPAKTVPLLMPLEAIPFIGAPIAAALDPPLRVLIETGYDRTINPGQPTPAKWLYIPNLIKTAVNFVVAIPTGWDNAIAEITGNPANRPFGTTVPGPYGVGGPPVYSGAVDPYVVPPTPLTIPLVQATATPLATVAAADAASPRRRSVTTAPAATATTSSIPETAASGADATSPGRRSVTTAPAATATTPSIPETAASADRPSRRAHPGVAGSSRSAGKSASSSPDASRAARSASARPAA